LPLRYFAILSKISSYSSQDSHSFPLHPFFRKSFCAEKTPVYHNIQTAVEVVNTLLAAQATHSLPDALKRYRRPRLLILDELGYLPIDKAGADLLFQVFSQRYERGSTLITTNQAYKNWLRIFNNDSTMTSAVLDRVLHHAETVPIEGKSYRMKDVIEEA
jgi:DNA replication protein DnaC